MVQWREADLQEEHMENEIKRYRSEIKEGGEGPPWLWHSQERVSWWIEDTYLHIRERRLEAEIQLQRCHHLGLL